MRSDTIVAVSTPVGVGGMATVRVSGPEALAVSLRHLSVAELLPRHATYCRFDELDDVVAVYMPHGYTCEETVEVSCHGSLYVQEAILQSYVDSGARLAEPGEFTRRAFLNGRLDLSQAEAVADLIEAVTPVQHRLAVSQLRGGYAQELKSLRQHLLDLTSLLELELDFSQEDVEFADRGELRRLLSTITSQLSTLIASFREGNALKRGVPVAIVGRPNAGKSSLLNALLHDERAIVSEMPGTTRDTVEESVTLDGITFRFIDTAGLRHSTDTVEAMGIERSRKAVADARIVLYVHDSTLPWEEPMVDLTGKRVIVVFNKSDLAEQHKEGALSVSAKNGDGIETIVSVMVDEIRQSHSSDTLLTNARHYEAMCRVRQALADVDTGLASGIAADLLVVDLRDALYHLGTITGEVTSEELLGNIFSRFCVGK